MMQKVMQGFVRLLERLEISEWMNLFKQIQKSVGIVSMNQLVTEVLDYARTNRFRKETDRILFSGSRGILFHIGMIIC